MSDIILWVSITVIVSGLSYYIPLLLAQQKIDRAQQEQQTSWNNLQKNLSEEIARFNQQKIIELTKISERKSEALKEYQKALESIKVAEQIRNNSQERNLTLQKQITQLQSELFNARKRAARFANRNQKAENTK